jgi:uncharacterized protein YuzE
MTYLLIYGCPGSPHTQHIENRIRMKDFKVSYDDKEDILYLAREGQEEEVVELSPGVNVELDMAGELIGIELFNASSLLKDVIKPLEKRIQAA